MLIRACIVSESQELGRSLEKILRQPDVLVSRPTDGDLWSCIGADSYDLVISTRSAIPGPPGEAVAALQNLPERPELVVLVEPGRADERAALQAAGAFAVVDADLPDSSLRKALDTLIRRRREALLGRLRSRGGEAAVVPFARPAAKSGMGRLLELAERVAAGDSSLLVIGETGVGKEWLARWIHQRGPRAEGPFVAVNCAALPGELVESELFGHEQGAFTGALRARRGQFELAHQGTLFLDEIAEMPLAAQSKLLRALQDREIRRVGSERPIRVDARIVAATNRDPEEAIRARHLREDLFYRLGVVVLEVPPLRERAEEIGPLSEECFLDLRRRLRRPEVDGLSPQVTEALRTYPWPGNVRELINVLERAILLTPGPTVTLDDLPGAVAHPDAAGRKGRTGRRLDGDWDRLVADSFELPLGEASAAVTETYEREYLRRLLEEAGGRVGQVARRAGIDERTVYNKMRRYGLAKEDFRAGVR